MFFAHLSSTGGGSGKGCCHRNILMIVMVWCLRTGIAYPSSAGSCHTATDGHGAALEGAGGFGIQLIPNYPTPGSVMTCVR